MSGPIDHRAEAVRLLRNAEAKAATSGDYTAVALAHITLALAPDLLSGPPREPSAKFHPQGTTIADRSS